jgi:hypothetical protein
VNLALIGKWRWIFLAGGRVYGELSSFRDMVPWSIFPISGVDRWGLEGARLVEGCFLAWGIT